MWSSAIGVARNSRSGGGASKVDAKVSGDEKSSAEFLQKCIQKNFGSLLAVNADLIVEGLATPRERCGGPVIVFGVGHSFASAFFIEELAFGHDFGVEQVAIIEPRFDIFGVRTRRSIGNGAGVSHRILHAWSC